MPIPRALRVSPGHDRHEPWRKHGDRPQVSLDHYRTAVDVGTAQGDLIAQVALANPHLSGIGFDLPAVAPIFEEYVAANGLSDRVKFSPGVSSTSRCPRPM